MQNDRNVSYLFGNSFLRKTLKGLAVGSMLCILACCTTTETAPPAPAPKLSAKDPNAHQHIFETPQQAVEALVIATRDGDKPALIDILGSRAEKIVYSGDHVADQQSRGRFLAAYNKAHLIKADSNGQDTLIVGDEQWPLPIPLVHGSSGWWFDTAAGEQEILNRRIGRNELNVIETCRAYSQAQQEFAAINSQHEYAQHFQSTKGKYDGLYWHSTGDQPKSPLGSLIAQATAAGYSDKTLSTHRPYQGYYYRILTQQGPAASGGATDYIVNGHMTGGYALVAFPARYGDSGVMTFIINQHGIVYEKNLGQSSATVAKQMTQFNPDDSWKVVRE